MKRRILYVEDDIDLAGLTSKTLEKAGYEISYMPTLCNIKNVILQFTPNLLALDIEVGSLSSLDLLSDITTNCPHIPILFISSHSDIHTVTESIERGVSLFLKKPYGIKELIQTVKILLPLEEVHYTIFGKYQLRDRILSFNHEQITMLTPKEQHILLVLLNHKGSYVSKDQLLRTIWGNDHAEESLYNCISHLRKYLSQENNCLLKSLRSEGYKILTDNPD